jgi:septum formation protein
MFAFIYLASQSPRRQALLSQLGVCFTPLLASMNENVDALEIPLPIETAYLYVELVARAKVMAAQLRWQNRVNQGENLPWAPILCADTTVSLGASETEKIPLHSSFTAGEIIGKPQDTGDAQRILEMLSGKEHRVLTAVCVMAQPEIAICSVVQTSRVRFANLDKATIEAYIASGEPLGKAGAYGIQGLGGALIESIAGSYSGIMGLPLYETAQLLIQAKVCFALNHNLINSYE